MNNTLLFLILYGMCFFSAQAQSNPQEFLCGEVYLSAHNDTIALKELGFCDFKYIGRSVGTLKYRAQWPRTIAQSQLPNHVTTVDDNGEKGRAYTSSTTRTVFSIPSCGTYNPYLSRACRTISQSSEQSWWYGGAPYRMSPILSQHMERSFSSSRCTKSGCR